METLTLDERERIVDSALKIQSVRNSLDLVGENKIPSFREIAACLKSVDHNLRAALGYVRRLRPDTTADPRKAEPATPDPALDGHAVHDPNRPSLEPEFPVKNKD